MKLGLKLKLVISYVTLAVFLVLSLLWVSNYFLEKQFQVYMTHKQDMKNEEIVNLIAKSYGQDGTPPDTIFLNTLGNNLLEQGIILMVHAQNGAMLFCMNTLEGRQCTHTLESMETFMKENCPDFEGAYTEKGFEIVKDGKKLGTVRLGYYGPFYYRESEHNFISAFNRVFLVTGLLFFIASVAIGLFMASKIAEPIKKVTERTGRIAEGEYAERVGLLTRTVEIDALSASVDHLAESLETQLMLKKRMAHAYSHEFRTPLAALQSNLEAMIDGLWEPTRERLESLHAEIVRLSRMVSEVDNLVRVKKQEDVPAKTFFDLSDMTDQVLRSFETHIQSKKIHLSHDKENCRAYADPDKLSQVVVNLISNAVKYTNPGGHIRIRTYNKGSLAVFCIEDDGIGIEEKDLPHIFEHLYRADESRNRDTGGNGIGLCVVKSILEAHGGRIEVRSKPQNGSRFVVTV